MSHMQELQDEIVSATLDAVSGADWTTATILYRKVAKYGEAEMIVTAADGSTSQPKLPSDVVFAFSDLRKAMATPNHGTWLSAIVTVRKDDVADFEFNYDQQPNWNVEVAPEIYLEDLDLYPRPADEVPSWHPGRKAS